MAKLKVPPSLGRRALCVANDIYNREEIQRLLDQTQHLAGFTADLGARRDKGTFMATVLVVEDEQFTALAVSEALAEAGYRVEMVSSAAAAYAKLAPEPRSFSAVVTDVNLGEGDDGFAVAEQARTLNPQIQVAFMTGNPANLARFRSDSALMFPKPFDLGELVEQLSLLTPA